MFENLPSLREEVEIFGLAAQKALGQNFLLDKNILNKIIESSLAKQDKTDFSGAAVFEIGCGPGGLSRVILEKKPQKLTIIEMDKRFEPLAEELKNSCESDLEFVLADALKENIAAKEGLHKHIVSNLPYNISVPLLIGWLKQIQNFESLTLMFQKEVADRILSPIKNKNYGRISILSQLLCQTDKLFDINPQCFVPAPKVWSSVLLFRPKNSNISATEIEKIEELSQMAFGQRRKMIRQSLKKIADLEEKCNKIGVVTTVRAEELSPEQFLALARLDLA